MILLHLTTIYHLAQGAFFACVAFVLVLVRALALSLAVVVVVVGLSGLLET